MFMDWKTLILFKMLILLYLHIQHNLHQNLDGKFSEIEKFILKFIGHSKGPLITNFEEQI